MVVWMVLLTMMVMDCIIMTNLNQHGLCTKCDLHQLYPHLETPALLPRLGFLQQHGEVNRATKGLLFRIQ